MKKMGLEVPLWLAGCALATGICAGSAAMVISTEACGPLTPIEQAVAAGILDLGGIACQAENTDKNEPGIVSFLCTVIGDGPVGTGPTGKMMAVPGRTFHVKVKKEQAAAFESKYGLKLAVDAGG